jgi:hypothetical protein
MFMSFPLNSILLALLLVLPTSQLAAKNKPNCLAELEAVNKLNSKLRQGYKAKYGEQLKRKLRHAKAEYRACLKGKNRS